MDVGSTIRQPLWWRPLQRWSGYMSNIQPNPSFVPRPIIKLASSTHTKYTYKVYKLDLLSTFHSTRAWQNTMPPQGWGTDCLPLTIGWNPLTVCEKATNTGCKHPLDNWLPNLLAKYWSCLQDDSRHIAPIPISHWWPLLGLQKIHSNICEVFYVLLDSLGMT